MVGDIMRNPLVKRYPRELKRNLGKYIVIFLFMVITIGFVSGFLVADNSMQKEYNSTFDKYNIEDGHFVLENKLTSDLRKKLKKKNIKIYNTNYKQEKTDKLTYRVFINRKKVNMACVLSGRLAEAENEIAVDRVFAGNNDLKIGDTVSLQKMNYKIVGIAALSDYSALFRSNSDLMFDAQHFTVALVTDKGFKKLSDKNLKYQYSYTFNEQLSDNKRSKESDKIRDLIAENALMTDFVKEMDNQAIHFAGDDLGGDESMMMMFLYIIIVIMAFVFAVTTSNTIENEAAVIGTLRASGYSKLKLLRHYITLPIFVTILGALAGNALGYTYFRVVCANMYLNSYSLTAYKTLWTPYAFVMTTVIPIALMLIINTLIISIKLSLSPLKFLRRDLKRGEKKRALRLPNFRFIARFRIRVIFQNLPSYLLLFIGVVLANVLLLFGMMMTPLLDSYKENAVNNMLADYQYLLKAPADTDTKGVEKFALTQLERRSKFSNFRTADTQRETVESFSVYGILKNSKFVDLNIKKNEVYATENILEKFGYKIGDKLTLSKPYSNKKYTFKIKGTYDYPSSFALFMNIDSYRDRFDTDKDYYSGYFSNKEIKDIDDEYIATTITKNDLTIVSDQLTDSMGKIFPLFQGFSVLLFVLLVYLLSKVIIEKNSNSISIVKILGFKNGEIVRLYIIPTAIVVALSIGLSLPIAYTIIKELYVMIMYSYAGWLPLAIAPDLFVKIAAIGVVSYAVIGYLQYRRVKKIPMNNALKNTE